MSSVRRREGEHILRICLNDHLRAYELVERQLSVLVVRAQVMLSLSGIVITVTGFSGRAIAETSQAARICISAGILVVLAAAAVAIAGVLRLKWLSQEIDDEPIVTLLRILEMRDRKSRNLGWALSLFVAGLSLYCVAIAQLLLGAHPPG
jgi:ATP/ADP translocase